MWVDPPNVLKGYAGDVDKEVLDRGEIAPNAASKFPGPTGMFRLMPEEHWRWIDPEDPAPIFLHETWISRIEKWVQPISGPGEDVRAVSAVRDAVMQMVDSRLISEPRTLTLTPTHTSTERVGKGFAVVGRCILLSPS